MNLKFYFFLFCLATVQSLSANNFVPALNTPSALSSEELGCTLPPPTALNANMVGTDWVRLSWPSVSGAAQYRIQIVEEQSGNVLSTTFVAGNTTSADISTAGNQGNPFHGEIVSVCYDGSYNPAAFRKSGIILPIIIELIASGFTPIAAPSANCPVSINPGCSFDWLPIYKETPFQVRYGTQLKRQFSVQVTVSGQGGANPQVKIRTENGNTGLLFVNSGDGSNFYIKLASTGAVLATLTTSHPISPNMNLPGYLKLVETANSNTIVERLLESGFAAPPGENSAEISNERKQTPESQLHWTISPNPFNDNLSLQVPQSKNSIGANIRLYDLLGSVKRTCTTTADQAEINFNTADLTPGVYFLQIESGGKVETIKVLKTQ